jgi:multidrug efflux pump subunit AcrA (membrane-fusion protein)
MQVAQAEAEMMQEANKRHEGTFPKIDLQKGLLAFLQAEANYDLQKYTIEEVKKREVTVRENELDRTEVMIGLRKLVAPIDGIVVKIEHAEGEWLREGDVVLEIMQLDTLRFRGKVDAKLYEINEIEGRPATVYVKLASGKTEAFPGKVVFANPIIDAGKTYDVHINVQNKPSGNSWQLQPGRDDAEAVIQLDALK